MRQLATIVKIHKKIPFCILNEYEEKFYIEREKCKIIIINE